MPLSQSGDGSPGFGAGVKANSMKKRKLKFEPGDFDLRVKRSSAGLGLFTFSDIPKGACVIEYKGRFISREEEYTSRSLYLFEVNSRVTIDGSPRLRLVEAGRPKWNKAGYINHSCRPNCEVEIRGRRVFIMARRRIKAGEELNYDYGTEYWKEHIGPEHCRCPKCAERRQGKKARRAV
jgi:uncharacterized protein